MFTINCHRCHKTSLVNLQNVRSMHRSSEGTVAYVDCHCGHTAVHVFPRPERVVASWMVETPDDRATATAC